MLIELNVSNYALIENLCLRLSPRLNVLSGETGAGKSIIIGALGLLLGERASGEQVRLGEERALIEAFFSLDSRIISDIGVIMDEAGLIAEEELIISREISRSGRSLARVNGRAMPVSFLKRLGQCLVDLHGQHEHQSLLRPDHHLALLDAFGGEELALCRRQVADIYIHLRKLKQEREYLGLNTTQREQRMDVLGYQIKEIGAAALDIHEEEELLAREKIISHAEKLSTSLCQAYTDLFVGVENSKTGSVADGLHAACRLISEASAIDPKLAPVVDCLESISIQLQELALEIKGYLDNITFDSHEQDWLQQRLALLADLKRKYGPTLEQVLEYYAAAQKELQSLQNSAQLAERLQPQIAETEQRYYRASTGLSELRQKAGHNLEQQLHRVLGELALPNTDFSVSIIPRDQPSAQGMDRVEFMFSANPGEPLKPLAKIISGGETSRLMLALKTILARQDRIPVLIFDEIDAGIGGATIQAVAEKLSNLSRYHQVLCVTHSPQIAALADRHYSLHKEVAGERTLTKAAGLGPKERRMEIARMLDGAGINRTSLQHADEMLKRAAGFKKAEGGDLPGKE